MAALRSHGSQRSIALGKRPSPEGGGAASGLADGDADGSPSKRMRTAEDDPFGQDDVEGQLQTDLQTGGASADALRVDVSAAQLEGAAPGEAPAIVKDRKGSLLMQSQRQLASDVGGAPVVMSLPRTTTTSTAPLRTM